MNNPFTLTLTFGALPEHFISRSVMTNRILDDFSSERSSSGTLWHELGEQDKKVVLAICETENLVKVRDLRETLGMSSGLFSPYRDKLIRKGLVDVSRYGYIGLIHPRFREYAIARNEYDNL